MATRFYLPSSGTAATTPAYDAEWDNTASAARLPLSRLRNFTTMSSVAATDATATTDRDVLIRQYISGPLRAQTISGTVKGQIRVQEGNANQNLRSQVIIRVIADDGTVRGTLYAGDTATLTGNPTSEWATTLVNRQAPRGGAISLSSVSAQDSDRIVVEIGYRKHAALSTTGTLRIGDNGTSGLDLPEDEAGTSDYNPWIEFSGNILGGFVGRRLYFPSAGAAPISPTYTSTWERTTDADRLKATSDRGSTTLTEKSASQAAVNFNGSDMLIRQYVSEYPLQAQTITGSAQGQMRFRESDAGADYSVQMVVKVMAANGTTQRGVLYAGHNLGLGNELATTLTNRNAPRGSIVALSSVTAQAGDYLVVEIGVRAHGGTATAFIAYADCGEDGTDALPVDETETAAGYPWLNFSGEIAFQEPIILAAPAAVATGAVLAPALVLAASASAATSTATEPTLRASLSIPAVTASAGATAPVLAAPVGVATASAAAPLPTPRVGLAPPLAAASGDASAPTLPVRGAIPVATATGGAPSPVAVIAAAVPITAATGDSLAPVLVTVAPGTTLTPDAPAAGSAAGISPALLAALPVPLAAAIGAVSTPGVRPTLATPLAAAAGASLTARLVLAGPAAAAAGAALAPALQARGAAPVASASASALAPTPRAALPVPLGAASGASPAPRLAWQSPTAGGSASAATPALPAGVLAPLAIAASAVPMPAMRAVAVVPPGVASAAGQAAALALPAPAATTGATGIAPQPRAAIASEGGTAAAEALTPTIPALGTLLIAPPVATAGGAGVAPTTRAALPQAVAAAGVLAAAPVARVVAAALPGEGSASATAPRLAARYPAPIAGSTGAASVPSVLARLGIDPATATGQAAGVVVDILAPLASAAGSAPPPIVLVVASAATSGALGAALAPGLPGQSTSAVMLPVRLDVVPLLEGRVAIQRPLDTRLDIAPVVAARLEIV